MTLRPERGEIIRLTDQHAEYPTPAQPPLETFIAGYCPTCGWTAFMPAHGEHFCSAGHPTTQMVPMTPDPRRSIPPMILRVLIGVLLAALAYFLLVALGLPVIVGIVAAILILAAVISGDRF